jgi:hypothetical protein
LPCQRQSAGKILRPFAGFSPPHFYCPEKPAFSFIATAKLLRIQPERPCGIIKNTLMEFNNNLA